MTDRKPDDRLANVQRWLADERKARDAAQRAAFAEKLRARIAAEDEASSTSAEAPVRSGRRWPRLLLAAAALTAAIAVMAMMMDWKDRPDPRLLRRQAVAANMTAADPALVPTELLADFEGDAVVITPYDYEGERCLWIFRVRDLRFDDAAEEAEFNRRPQWRTTVVQGRLAVPAAAVRAAYDDPGALRVLRVGRHLEIWDRAALERFLDSG